MFKFLKELYVICYQLSSIIKTFIKNLIAAWKHREKIFIDQKSIENVLTNETMKENLRW